jgi:hypothetical protein
MTHRLAGIDAIAATALIAALSAFAPSRAAGQQPAVPAPSYVPARTPDGHPDLQGVWRVWNLARYDIEPHAASQGVPAGPGVIVDSPDGLIPYQPWALARKNENFAKSRITYPYDPLQNPDQVARCYVPGVPRITYLGWPFEIVQTGELVGIVYEWMHIRRMIPLSDRPVPEGVNLWGGVSRGRWDGDTLVVRVTNLSDWTWLDMAGNFHSKAVQVEERYTPVGPDTLDYEVTIEDPNVYTRPWKMRMPIQRQRDVPLLEYECHELLEESGVPLTWDRDWDKPLEIPKE